MSEIKENCTICGAVNFTAPCRHTECLPGRQPELEELLAPVPLSQIKGKVSEGTTTFSMADGTVIALYDWKAGSIYSSMIIEPYKEDTGDPIRLFTYSRAQAIPNTNKFANIWHTNVWRSSDGGLPRGFEALVYGIRAETNYYTPEVLAWAAKTNVRFSYNQKTYYETSLLSLLEKTEISTAENAVMPDMDGSLSALKQKAQNGWTLPVRIRENLSYSVEVESDRSASANLRAWLRDKLETNPSLKEGFARLDTIANLAGANVASEIKKALEIMMPHRDGLLVRVHLDGLWKTPVV